MSQPTQNFVAPKVLLLHTVTTLFSFFANDITNPLVAAFKDVFPVKNAQAVGADGLHDGYGTMAIPAALFIRRFHKAAFFFGFDTSLQSALICARASGSFNRFDRLRRPDLRPSLSGNDVNPTSFHAPGTATRRLNLAQAFNPIGSLTE